MCQKPGASHTREHARSGLAARPDVGRKLEQHLRGEVNDGLHEAKNAEQIMVACIFAEASAGTSRRFRSEISFASILAFPTLWPCPRSLQCVWYPVWRWRPHRQQHVGDELLPLLRHLHLPTRGVNQQCKTFGRLALCLNTRRR